jgi:hypothetical protein
MSLGDLTGIVTAAATALTVALLGWDRFEKNRLPTPNVEFTSEWLNGAKRRFDGVFTVRNRSDVALRIGAIRVREPRNTVFRDGEKIGPILYSGLDVGPHESCSFKPNLQLPEDRVVS